MAKPCMQTQELIFGQSINDLDTKRSYTIKKGDMIDAATSDYERRRLAYPSFEKEFLYGYDPIDFVCNDFFTRLEYLLPC
eukprot:CAMPEP_0114584158 /NCGR_PEP_ID=MMETSP0125-20121206/7882_1 /TAXON_ID=485358 ORGANISM="Aristerostoma sp., Strain ATCC 50986" /NCGR_SAMPLE_ID=MMETSP0125 /ASSEMBLY_ACC=CAM_ASM_000245 /LENGTH=79 /DNA_ID=CAMNT_0001778317 /DNA_START=139 /DNA_END=378 /DNA_ORIENTATION=+